MWHEDWEDCPEVEERYDHEEMEESFWDDEDCLIDGVGFQDPGGRSSLRRATKDNPRIYPCPTCERENVLTRIDQEKGHQCNSCADADEGRF